MDKISLTAIMPNYNCSGSIGTSIEAIVNQSLRPDVLHIIDDASTDDSLRIIKLYQQKYPFIRVTENSENQGVFKFFFNIARECDTDYIYPCSSDDRVLPGYFEKAMGLAAQNTQTPVIFSAMSCVDMTWKRISGIEVSAWKKNRYYSRQEFLKDFLMKESPMRSFGTSTIYKTDIYNATDPARFKGMNHLYDNFLLRLLGLQYGCCYIAEESVQWMMRPGSMSQSAMTHKSEMHRLISVSVSQMRSDEFRSVFPEEYVLRWKRQYIQFVNLYSNPVFRIMIRVMMWLSSVPVAGKIIHSLERGIRKICYR